MHSVNNEMKYDRIFSGHIGLQIDIAKTRLAGIGETVCRNPAFVVMAHVVAFLDIHTVSVHCRHKGDMPGIYRNGIDTRRAAGSVAGGGRITQPVTGRALAGKADAKRVMDQLPGTPGTVGPAAVIRVPAGTTAGRSGRSDRRRGIGSGFALRA